MDEESLLEQLRSHSPSERLDAIEKLTEHPSPDAIKRLIQGLRDPEPNFRAACAKALGSLRCIDSIEPLIQSLTDSNSTVRQATADAFWDFASNSPAMKIVDALAKAVPYLKVLVRNDVTEVRIAATGALATIRTWDCLAALKSVVRDHNDEVRRYAIWGLGRIPHRKSVPILVDALLSDPVPIVRRNAAVAIGAIAGKGGVRTKNDLLLTSASVLIGLQDPHHKVRQNATHALATLPTQESVDGIVEVFNDPSAEVRQVAAWALGEMAATDGITGHPLDYSAAMRGLRKLFSDADDEVRRFAVWAVGKIALKDTSLITFTLFQLLVPQAIQLLRDPIACVRKNAVFALGIARSEFVVPALSNALNDVDFEVRVNAAFALGNIGSLYAIPALTEKLTDQHDQVRINSGGILIYLMDQNNDPLAFQVAMGMSTQAIIRTLDDCNMQVRKNAIKLLAILESEKAIPRLIACLEDPRLAIRARAAWALGEMKVNTAVEPLIASLQDNAPSVRRAAARALGNIGEPAAFPALKVLLRDPHPEVQHSAKIAILRLSI